MYVWHKYWSRKTWNVVGEFIRCYTDPGEVVFDPFAGSGVVAIEAIRSGRRAIVCDFNPAATIIIELTLRPANLLSLRRAYDRVKGAIAAKIDSLYEIHCVNCRKPLVCTAFVREGDQLTEVRYPKCPSCGHRAERATPLPEDVLALADLESRPIVGWFPTNRFFYDDGTPFLKREKYDSVDELFTRRNLQALAWLYEAIQDEPSDHLRSFLMGGFTSMVHLCSRMMPLGNPQPTNHYTFFSSPGWTQHSYWSAPRSMEQNVWEKFASSIEGNQGLLRAKEESNRELPKVKITSDWRKVMSREADVAIINADCIEAMNEMPDECVDYIFTDPPYDNSVQYGELSLLWNAWLRKASHYSERLVTSEVIHNDRQGKSFNVYHSLMSNSFRECHRLLNANRYLTLTFHNPTFKVRNATVRAGVYAGFDFQKVHHQPLGQVSAKSMLQPFGSAQGDFYLRFQKPVRDYDVGRIDTIRDSPAGLDDDTSLQEERFRKVVLERCREVIAERAEPTPYTILINHVDPALARHGFFGTLKTGLDVRTVLEESIGQEFVLVPSSIGSATGQQWWFKDPVFVARLKEVPLSERVEQTVYRILADRGRVTFTDIWDGVSREFPNSLTSDTTSIREALEIYARKVGTKGQWMLRDEIADRIRSHSEIIGLLALIGAQRGYDIWIGKPEQATTARGIVGEVKLASLVTVNPRAIEDVSNLKDVLLMDLLWLNGGDVKYAFEVESTTTMTSALQRGSNLPAGVPKIMVIPEEREPSFQRKMQSPLFAEHFVNESWHLLYFDALRDAYLKTRETTDIGVLLNQIPASIKQGRKAVVQSHLPF
ncbi:MAG: hypothetical protein QOC81_2114 [Thermoanaerobaculia bacterium]|jgi:16S rRNA G966 N2-methylase RsmD/DNA-directed RNA polymerase subunit RPC12/RpoP|nr:hypothetical protein [Thermoanaerobaculia bacterium]